jgi:hypothetical protein
VGPSAGLDGSVASEGGANTTAVLEIDEGNVPDVIGIEVVAVAVVSEALTGGLMAGFGFCPGARRTGAKARLADHPLWPEKG